ncbi:zinc finger protein 764-like [Branchiostoma floridae]|uniref:Zinc finger protein 764-like n=1 Tax=Branchiostoma floridae TaxID=7739 RepID=A0A9J7HQ37_BRAFL|nr:zinc finger protein 764-like [Branchiostoma floridae]
MTRQQEFICGLSHEVTIAVLPRLNMEELMFELNRRIQNLDKENSIKDRLVSILRDVMLEEYRQWEKLEVSPEDKRTIPEHEQETEAMDNNVPTPYTCSSTSETPTSIRQVLREDTYNSMSTSCRDKSAEDGGACEETPLSSCQPTPDHTDVGKWECRMSEDDQARHISQPSIPDHPERNTYDRSRLEQLEEVKIEETPLPPCQVIPDKDYDNMASFLPSNSSQIDSRSYLCDVCGFKTLYPDNLSKHMQRHTGQRPFMCDECGYRAYSNFRLVEHMRTHSGEKPFQCGICDYKAAFKAGIAAHMKRHMDLNNADAEPFTCGLCDYRTYRKQDMKRHMKHHTGVKTHKCEECDYSTAYKQALVRHRRQHTGEKPYVCQVCGFQTNDSSSLARHVRRKHQ